MFLTEEIENIIGYKFKNKELLKRAFLHSSTGFVNNERLEFMGDSVLDLVVSDKLFQNSNNTEGDLTKKRSNLVCEKSLANIVKSLKLDKFIVFGNSFKGEPTNAICGDLFESIVGAIYLDSNNTLDEVRKFVYRFLNFSVLNEIDYKTALQEIIQKNKNFKLEYQTKQLEKDVPNFVCNLYINEKLTSTANGKSKKEAERECAKIAYEKLKG